MTLDDFKRYAVGDRVVTPRGEATVVRFYPGDWSPFRNRPGEVIVEFADGSRAGFYVTRVKAAKPQ